MNQGRTIRLPIHVRREIGVYLKASRHLAQGLDHDPRPEEIADLLDKPVTDVQRMLRLNEPIQSVDVPCGKDADTPLVEMLPDEHTRDAAEEILDDTIHDGVEHWLSQLDDRQYRMVECRFGLHGYRKSTLQDVTDELDVSRERVRQIQSSALERRRAILEEEGFSVASLF